MAAADDERILEANGRVAELLRRGDTRAALALASETAEQALQGLASPLQTVVSLNNLATVHRTLGRYAEAEAIWRQALELVRAAFGDDDVLVAGLLTNLALLRKDTGELAEAKALLERALAIHRASAEPDPAELATTLNNLGELERVLSLYGAAAGHLREALELWRAIAGEDSPSYARGLSNLGLLRRSQGAYAEAERYYEQALAINRRNGGEHSPGVAETLLNLASVWAETGRFREAEQGYGELRAQLSATLGPGHPRTVTVLNNLAGLCQTTGRYAEARALFEQAKDRAIAALGPWHPDVARILDNVAGLRYATGDYAGARELYEQGLAIWERLAASGAGSLREHAVSLGSLATVHHALGQLEAAERASRQALAELEQALGPVNPTTVDALLSLAEIVRDAGSLDEARALLERAIAVLSGAAAEGDDRALANALSNLGGLEQSLGRHAESEPLLRRSLALRRAVFGDRHPDVGISLGDLAICCAATGRGEEALRLHAEWAAIEDATGDEIFASGSDRQRLAHIAQARTSLFAWLSLVRTRFAADPGPVRDVAERVLRRKGLTAAALEAQHEAVMGGRRPELRERFAALRELRSALAERLRSSASDGIVELRARLERLEGDLAAEVPELRLAARLRSVDITAVCGALPAGSALVEIVAVPDFDHDAAPALGAARWGRVRYLAFVFRAGAEGAALVDLGPRDPVDALVADLVRGMGRRRRTGGQEGDVELRRLVLDPLRAALGGARRLIVAPDGDLARLPLEVLPTTGERRVIDDYEISYVSAGRDVLRFGAGAPQAPGEPLVLADPDFDLDFDATLPAARRRFGRLAGTELEGLDVGSRLGVEPLTADRALKRALTEAASPRILHLATHGFFEEDLTGDPIRRDPTAALALGGLAFAGANAGLSGGPLPPEAAGGILYAAEVLELDLVATELVVLSACDTGVGAVTIGEGVFGLRRAFAVAGADTLVMSLWSVPDMSTQRLMSRFYVHLLAGVPKALALRRAQLEIRRSEPDPVHWGAFICQGDPGPLRAVQSSAP